MEDKRNYTKDRLRQLFNDFDPNKLLTNNDKTYPAWIWVIINSDDMNVIHWMLNNMKEIPVSDSDVLLFASKNIDLYNRINKGLKILNFTIGDTTYTLSEDFINCVRNHGWIIISKLGEGSRKTAYNVIKNGVYAALTIENRSCELYPDSKLKRIKELQDLNILDTKYMVKVFASFNCNVKLSNDSNYPCEKIVNNAVEIIERADMVLYQKMCLLYLYGTEDEKVHFVLKLRNFVIEARNSFMKNGYMYLDMNQGNIALINDRFVFIDLDSLIPLEKTNPMDIYIKNIPYILFAISDSHDLKWFEDHDWFIRGIAKDVPEHVRLVKAYEKLIQST